MSRDLEAWGSGENTHMRAYIWEHICCACHGICTSMFTRWEVSYCDVHVLLLYFTCYSSNCNLFSSFR